MNRRKFLLGLSATPLVCTGSYGVEPSKIVVHKDPTCGCCTGWVEHVRAAGFPVEVSGVSDINRVKVRLGIPSNLYACHTAEVDGYVIEGHVPASAVKRLLVERPKVKGLAVRGMPLGSPGMEVEGAEPETYDVVAFRSEGQSPFARFKGSEPI